MSSATTPRCCARAIRDDALLHLALAHDDAEVMVLGHTRWASVGIISEANAHPLNHEELDGHERPYVVGALNGDVDNYADLKALEGLQVPAEITTDAKVIPALVARRIESGATVQDAFRTTVSELAGSMGIAAQTAAAPDRLLLSLRGSGQALYVGMVEDAYVVASEPYGLVEETSTYLRMDGETPGRSRARRGHPRPGGGARRERRGHARRHRAATRSTARRCRCTRTSCSTPRSPPATSTAATSRTSCSRRSRRRRRRSARRCAARWSNATVA